MMVKRPEPEALGLEAVEGAVSISPSEAVKALQAVSAMSSERGLWRARVLIYRRCGRQRRKVDFGSRQRRPLEGVRGQGGDGAGGKRLDDLGDAFGFRFLGMDGEDLGRQNFLLCAAAKILSYFAGMRRMRCAMGWCVAATHSIPPMRWRCRCGDVKRVWTQFEPNRTSGAKARSKASFYGTAINTCP